MVAITVILAAVIGTFVLGLGDSLGDNQPTAQLDVSIEDGASDEKNVTIEHGGGDPIDSETLEIIVTDEDGNEATASGEFSDRFSVGDVESGSFDATDSPGDTEELRIRIIHQPSESILVDQTIEVEDINSIDGGSITFN
ncbi:type IV pilin [Halorubrum cibi]